MYTFKCSSLGRFFRTMVGFNRVWVLVPGSGSGRVGSGFWIREGFQITRPMSGSSFKIEFGLDFRFWYRGQGRSLVSRPRFQVSKSQLRPCFGTGVGFRDPGRGRISGLGLKSNLGTRVGFRLGFKFQYWGRVEFRSYGRS